MSGSAYWKKRQARLMYSRMEDSEKTAREVAKYYQAASEDLNRRIENIYSRFQSKHGLSDAEARRMMESIADPVDFELWMRRLQRMKSSDPGYADLLAELESPAYQARIRRLQELQKQLDSTMQDLYQQEKRISTAHYAAEAENSYNHTVYDVQRQVGYQFSFATMDEKMLNDLIHSKWSGANYSKRIWDHTRKLAQDVKEQMVIGMITGKTEHDMASELAERYRVGAFEARRLIRTESCFVSNAAQEKAYEECGAEAYEYIATLDSRTDEECGALDGKVFPLNSMQPGLNAPPMHPFCRCTTAIHLDDETLDGLERRARDPETGKNVKVPASKNYMEWAKENGLIEPDQPAPKTVTVPKKKTPKQQQEKKKATNVVKFVVDALHPERIGGVERTKESMTFAEGDTHSVNPQYNKGREYQINCQSCVVVNEARRRGYDVEVLPNTPGSAADKLSRNTRLAWIDPATGKQPEWIIPEDSSIKTPKKYYKWLDDTIGHNGERYTIQVIWKGRRSSGHIINLDRDENGVLRFHDNQRGWNPMAKYDFDQNKWVGDYEKDEWSGEAEIVEYLKDVKFQVTVAGTKIYYPPKVVRVDDKEFNMEYADKIMRAHT